MKWLVDLVLDGADGLVREPRVVRGGDTASVPVVKDGGFAAIACRRRPGLTRCDRS
ncbi:hypothetical protein [Streptomyces sp. NBRC 110028]|uniref:hypothetical protein n=1 Tax=Streptomyces sp. NBRC 110028 TaxID=1621260 RepID=UPI000AB246BC|nr:hypothetical protein [Streptomyces sp. NBRC 110028]